MISIPYTNEAYINAKYVFGHQRRNEYNLVSHVSVKDLMLKNKDVLAVAVVMNTAKESHWNAREGEDVYIRMCAYTFACLDDDLAHCGDCICVACSCNTCRYERYYCEALVEICYFEDLIQIQSSEIKELIKNYDINILLLVVMQMTQSYWDNWKSNYDNGIMDPNSETCLREFLALSVEEQQEKYNRMVKVMEYINNPVKIEGIPWW